MLRTCTECHSAFEITRGNATQCSPKCFITSRTDKSGGPDACWLWTGRRNKTGYGVLSPARGKTMNAHRAAYIELVGPVPAALVIRHKCDNPRCVNPAHLIPGTHRENTLDMVSRGRHIEGQRRQIGENTSRAILTEAQVREIRAAADTQVNLARRYGVARRTIRMVLRRENWRHI